jgi:hypothetical protein
MLSQGTKGLAGNQTSWRMKRLGRRYRQHKKGLEANDGNDSAASILKSANENGLQYHAQPAGLEWKLEEGNSKGAMA